MAALDHIYRYPQPSSVETSADGAKLRLASECRNSGTPAFFVGDIDNPLLTARCLRAVSDLVAKRFYIHPSMLARILREADPVVTVSREELRFEGFSACGSTYVRHDIDQAGFTAQTMTPGTTNVDFQADMRAALARIRTGSTLHLSVRSDAVEVTSDAAAVVERKVPLPLRWIKGFAEVQSHLASMTKQVSLTRVATQRFLRSLPRADANHEQWLMATPTGARLSRRAVDPGVKIKGTQRLRLLEPLAANCERLDVYQSAATGSSAWVLHFAHQRLSFVLNAEPWRGFSGDGSLLSELAAEDSTAVATVKAELAWQSRLDVADLAQRTGQDTASVATALAVLASRGLVGYDLVTGCYFHRVLPFDLQTIEQLNPRLKSARALVEANAVAITARGDMITADVTSGGLAHRVSLSADTSTCTCPWYGKHRSERGPCKHIIATQMIAQDQT